MRRVGLALAAVLAGCGSRESVRADRPAEARPRIAIRGMWRAVLGSPGGDLPFSLRIDPDATPPAVALNATETVGFSSITRNGDRITLEIAGLDSRIRAELSADGKSMTGDWTRTALENQTRLAFWATRNDPRRFPAGPPPVGSVDGNWRVVFKEKDGSTYNARGEFRQQGSVVRGTFLTDTGDYRYLEGQLAGNALSLSCFDGSHAFLFRAKLDRDSMTGDFWSRDIYHATWTATRLADSEPDGLGDPFDLVHLTNEVGLFQFSFPDPDGNVLSSEDARFADKVVLIDIFGTWCPNCNDYAPLLVRWHRKYGQGGLEIVGLAFEFTQDTERSAEMVRRYVAAHGIRFPILVGGISDRTQASRRLPDLSEIQAYPTTVLVGRDGKATKIYSGFMGPATGEHHDRFVTTMEREIEALLAQPPPG